MLTVLTSRGREPCCSNQGDNCTSASTSTTITSMLIMPSYHHMLEYLSICLGTLLVGHLICYFQRWVAVRCSPVEAQTPPDSSVAQCGFRAYSSAASQSRCALFFLRCIPIFPLHSRQGPGFLRNVLRPYMEHCKLFDKDSVLVQAVKQIICLCRLNAAPDEEHMTPSLMKFTSVLKSKQAQRCSC